MGGGDKKSTSINESFPPHTQFRPIMLSSMAPHEKVLRVVYFVRIDFAKNTCPNGHVSGQKGCVTQFPECPRVTQDGTKGQMQRR